MNGNKTSFIKILPQSSLCVVISYFHILPKHCFPTALTGAALELFVS